MLLFVNDTLCVRDAYVYERCTRSQDTFVSKGLIRRFICFFFMTDTSCIRDAYVYKGYIRHWDAFVHEGCIKCFKCFCL